MNWFFFHIIFLSSSTGIASTCTASCWSASTWTTTRATSWSRRPAPSRATGAPGSSSRDTSQSAESSPPSRDPIQWKYFVGRFFLHEISMRYINSAEVNNACYYGGGVGCWHNPKIQNWYKSHITYKTDTNIIVYHYFAHTNLIQNIKLIHNW